MTNFFKDIKTFEELKKSYRKLAVKLHPDVDGGNHKQFIAMKEEYDRLFKTLKDSDNKNAKTHESVTYDFKDLIDKLIFMKNGDIEIIGSWVWVWGIKFEMEEERAILKKLGFEWSKNKKAWYLGQKGKYWKKGMSKNQMRNTFGSEKIGKQSPTLIED